MDPAPLDPAEHLRRLRQQVLLAQVRVMELEDARDATAARLADVERLVADAQRLADAKLDESAHLARTLAELQHEFQHLRHVQHVTNQALEETRAKLAATEHALGAQRSARLALEAQTAALGVQLATREGTLRELEQRHAALEGEAAARAARLTQLDAEQRALKASRSWRWTAWLRSLERFFGASR